VRWDLDIEAQATAEQVGLQVARAGTGGAHPAFVAAVRELVEEMTAGRTPRTSSPLGISGVDCPFGCCPAPARPAVASS
jgi:ferrochelatase